jgi:DNA-directed RNA polymerase subunit RPC12/RpoP
MLSMRVWKSLSEKNHVATTLIINCTQCNGLLLANEAQKTRTCPYCGKRIDLYKANKVASAESAFEASQILRELKAKRQTNVRKPKPYK